MSVEAFWPAAASCATFPAIWVIVGAGVKCMFTLKPYVFWNSVLNCLTASPPPIVVSPQARSRSVSPPDLAAAIRRLISGDSSVLGPAWAVPALVPAPGAPPHAASATANSNVAGKRIAAIVVRRDVAAPWRLATIPSTPSPAAAGEGRVRAPRAILRQRAASDA